MADYVNGELYKVSRRKYLYVTMASLAALELLLVVLWSWMNGNGDGMSYLTASDGFSMILWMLSVGFYASVLTSDMVFSEQYKHNTLKNEVSFGLSRTRVYLGKLTVEVVVSLVLCLLSFLIYGALCQLLLPSDGAWMKTLAGVGYGLLAALPLWLGCLAFIHMLFFLLKSTTAAALIVAATIAAAGQLLELLSVLVSEKFQLLHKLLFTTPLAGIQDYIGDPGRLGYAWAVGCGWFVVTTVIGLLVFRKKEIS